MFLAQGQNTAEVGLEPRPLDPESEALLLGHRATAPPPPPPLCFHVNHFSDYNGKESTEDKVKPEWS